MQDHVGYLSRQSDGAAQKIKESEEEDEEVLRGALQSEPKNIADQSVPDDPYEHQNTHIHNTGDQRVSENLVGLVQVCQRITAV